MDRLQSNSNLYNIICKDSELSSGINSLTNTDRNMVETKGIVTTDNQGNRYIEITTLPKYISIISQKVNIKETISSPETIHKEQKNILRDEPIKETISIPEDLSGEQQSVTRIEKTNESINDENSNWFKAGFSKSEARSWSSLKFNIQKAQQWTRIGVTAYTAYEWEKYGFTPEQAKEWKKVGVDIGYRAKKILQLGLDIDSYKQWKDLRINEYQLKKLNQSGISLKEVTLWSSVGIKSEELLNYKKSGIDFNLAKEWAYINVTSLYNMQRLISMGYDLETAKQWYGTGLRSNDWDEWRKAGITPEDAKKWVSIGANSLYEVNSFINGGIGLSEAIKWNQVGVSAVDKINSLKLIGIKNPLDKKEWDSVGVGNISKWIKNGLTWKEAKIWTQNGFNKIDDILMWKAKGFDALKAREQSEIDRKSAMEEKRTEERNQKVKETVYKIVFIIIVLLIIIGVFFGVTDRAVFYLDKQDLFLSFSPYIVALISLLFAVFTSWVWIIHIGIYIGAILAVLVIYKSFKFNTSFIKSISTAVGKLFLSLVYIIYFFEVISPSGKSVSEKRLNRSTGFIFMAILTPLLYKLVNGERVIDKREIQDRK